MAQMLRDRVGPRHPTNEAPDPVDAPRGWHLPAPATLLTVGFVLIGAGLRLRLYLHRPALWLDELSVALNLADRSFSGLTHELELSQAAPIGWLWTEKACFRVFGVSEYALRLPALSAGILLLVGTAVLSRQLLPAAFGWLPVAVVALCPPLIQYSNELKPYSSDALLVVVVLSATIAALRRRDLRTTVAWAAVTGLTALLSLPAVLAVAGSAAVLLAAGAAAVVRRRPRSPLLLATTALAQVPWVTAALWERRHLDPATVSANGFWAPGYPERAGETLRWLPGAVHRLGLYADVRPAGLLLPLVVLGALALVVVAVRTDRRLDVLPVLLTLAAAVVAAALQVYPLMERAALYLVAPAALAVAAVPAAGALLSGRRRTWWLVPAAALVLLLAFDWRTAALTTGPVRGQHPAKPPLALVAGMLRPGDVVVVHPWAPRAYRWYAGQVGLPQGFVLSPGAGDARSCSPRSAAEVLAPARRMWAVAIDEPTSGGRLSQRSFFAAAGTLGALRSTYHLDSGATVELFDLSDPAGLPQQPHGLCPVIPGRTPVPVAVR